MSGISYRSEIDGLRAVAVIPVILFHMGFDWIRGGFIGVDVFFVISGFLITSIIKHDLDAGTFSFRNFLARRIRRILPAMLFVTACTLAVTYFLVFRPEQQTIGEQGVAALLSIANIYFWRTTGDYWGSSAEESPFLHAWSLSLEEQFYLIFPVAMWLIYRFRPTWLQTSVASAGIASLALFAWGTQAYPTATFYLLPTRVWELGAGCLLAISFDAQRTLKSGYEVFAMVGLAMVVMSYALFDTLSGELGFAVFGTLLVLAFGQIGVCNKLLSQPLAVHLGKLSYSLYLWHWPVLVLAKSAGFDSSGAAAMFLLGCAIYVLALGTYHLVERPTRSRPGIEVSILASGLVVAGAALYMAWMPRYYNTTAFEEPTWSHYVFNLDPRERPEKVKTSVGRGVKMPLGRHSHQAFQNEGIVIGQEGTTPQLVVLGDSHGLMWSETIRNIAESKRITASFFSMGAVSPFFSIPIKPDQRNSRLSAEEKYLFDRARLRCLSNWNPKVVIISCNWNAVSSESAADLMQFLEVHAGTVLLIEDPPKLQIGGNHNAMQVACFKGISPIYGVKQYFPAQLTGVSPIEYLADRYSNASVVKVRDLYLCGSSALLLDGKSVVYVDDDHLTDFGASLALPRLREAIETAMMR